MRPGNLSASLIALVLAPRGRDAAVASDLVERAGVAARICRDLRELVGALGEEIAFVLLTEDAIHGVDLKPLSAWLGGQPAWSDMPFVLVTDAGGLERNPAAGRWLETLGNVSFVERPFHPTTLVSLARTMLKSRQRQHETRGLVERLRDSEARLRAALRAGHLRTWEFEIDRPHIVTSNGAGAPETLSGLDGIIGTIHPDDRGRVEQALRRTIATGKDYAVEFRRLRPDGSLRWLDARARLVREDGRRRLIGLSSDITDRKMAEEALLQLKDQLERHVEERTGQLKAAHDQLIQQIAERERSEEQLRHMQKLESIGQLTGGVAHDFNNLLTAVLGNLELVRKRLPRDPAIDALLDGAMQGAQRGAALTQRLLAFARRQALATRPVDLATLVNGITDLLRRSLGPTIDIRFDLPPDLPPARADANQVELALLNLAVNARDAMPGGGSLSIALDLVEAAGAPDLAAGRYLRLTVTDTGRGMDAATLARAIEPFFSTKEVGKGTGLGLSMIHGLAQQLRGALRLASQPGRGTTAELWLPADYSSAAREPPAAVPVRSESNRRATLLYVEDDFLIGLSTVALLEDLGHTVVHAASPAAALDILHSSQPVDLMITDYAMPGMTGVQLAQEARRVRPGLPMLLATGYADVPEAAELDLPRLSKPYQQRELAQHIGRLIG